jgi:hypothetical protein
MNVSLLSSFVWLRLYRKWGDHPEQDMSFARGGVNHITDHHIPTRVEREPHPPGRPWRDWCHASLEEERERGARFLGLGKDVLHGFPW